MLFHSIEFFIFFSIVYLCYLFLKQRGQNILLLFASYLFYGFWDWRFLSLIFISTVVDYFCGWAIDTSVNKSKKKFYLILSLCVNLGLLGFFKYFNFFQDNFIQITNFLGLPLDSVDLNIILPVGISFYTFQTMSYTIDIYRGELKHTRKFLDFALYVSFFPQLIAGPIERAKHLLPQILKPRKILLVNVKDGFFLIFWGIFEKIFIASNMAKFVDPVFNNHQQYSGFEILIACYAFAFQIFADFDSYSNIARGLAKCLGFDIMVNFNLPYFATNSREFWRRWHISLSTWLRDYLYIPLGGNLYGSRRTMINLFLVMFLGGLWHGAAWTFLVWGIYHGLLLIVKYFFSAGHESKGIIKAMRVIVFFHLVTIGWIFFRAITLKQSFEMIGTVFVDFQPDARAFARFLEFLVYLLPLCIIQLWQYKTDDLMIMRKQHWAVQTVMYSFLTYLVVGWGVMSATEFIYFQF